MIILSTDWLILKKMQVNIGESDILTIKNIFLSTKTKIGKGKTNISIKILQILQETNIRQIVADAIKLMISWDKKRLYIDGKLKMIKKGNKLK